MPLYDLFDLYMALEPFYPGMPLYGLHDFICLYMATSLASIKHHAVQILTQTSLSAHKLVDPLGGGSIYTYICGRHVQNEGRGGVIVAWSEEFW